MPKSYQVTIVQDDGGNLSASGKGDVPTTQVIAALIITAVNLSLSVAQGRVTPIHAPQGPLVGRKADIPRE